ncbi:43846_t:CDS:2 [Gigaspora margarita]|uniref:43846_t:CDS:1 n=1 Tax=Gigaspora margarita TaxID=4874 RepID=A0ABN7UJI7_GIGMA|nr:43846_t:CDS:2 [Gigaspora margarita]
MKNSKTNRHRMNYLNRSIPHKTENLIIYENILNSDQTENLIISTQENNERINIVHKNDEIDVDNSSTISTNEIDIDEILRRYSKNDKNNSSANSTNEIDIEEDELFQRIKDRLDELKSEM